VNNAGINRVGVFGEIAEQDWDMSLAVNLKGAAAMINWVARYWRDQGRAIGRAIVNTASPAAPHAITPLAAYSASKAGILALTQVAAQELAEFGARVNAIAPMARTRLSTESPEIAALMPKRQGFDRHLPEHVAQLVVYLVSSRCRFTGRLFGVEGDDVFLFSEYSASTHVSNRGAKWTPETIASALTDIPAQDRRWFMFPGGRLEGPSPPDETLRALG
jgi:NAD(P)-dependent dehydrogenase (short-subunit alcohol dehydrogenase family)